MSRLYLSKPCAFFRYLLHTVLRAQPAPGFPCALCQREGATRLQNPGENESRECFRLFETESASPRFLTLPWRGRVASHAAQRNAKRGGVRVSPLDQSPG